MKNFVKEHSYRYMATVCQITGIACSSGFASKVFNSITIGNLSDLSMKSNSAKYCYLMFFFGVVLIITGAYIMYNLDKNKASKGEEE